MEQQKQQQKLREWILGQNYFYLNPKYDGMTAWEIAGIILGAIGFRSAKSAVCETPDFQHNEQDEIEDEQYLYGEEKLSLEEQHGL